jgi:hypothetical protein
MSGEAGSGADGGGGVGGDAGGGIGDRHGGHRERLRTVVFLNAS